MPKEFEIDKNMSLGQILQDLRLKSCLEVDYISSSLNVKPQDIVDIENDEIYIKKSNFFSVNLVKAYASFLKADMNIIKNKLDLVQNIESASEYKLLGMDENKKFVPDRFMILSSTILVLVLYCIFSYDFGGSSDLTTDSIIDRIILFDD